MYQMLRANISAEQHAALHRIASERGVSISAVVADAVETITGESDTVPRRRKLVPTRPVKREQEESFLPGFDAPERLPGWKGDTCPRCRIDSIRAAARSMSAEEQRAAVRDVILLHPDWHWKKVAAKTGVDPLRCKHVKGKLISAGEISRQGRVIESEEEPPKPPPRRTYQPKSPEQIKADRERKTEERHRAQFDEALAALRERGEVDRHSMAEALGVASGTAQKRLRALVKAGLAEMETTHLGRHGGKTCVYRPVDGAGDA